MTSFHSKPGAEVKESKEYIKVIVFQRSVKGQSDDTLVNSCKNTPGVYERDNMCCRKEILLSPTRQGFWNATGGSYVPRP